MKQYSPFVWLALGALGVWFFFGRRVTATVSIGDGAMVGGQTVGTRDPIAAADAATESR